MKTTRSNPWVYYFSGGAVISAVTAFTPLIFGRAINGGGMSSLIASLILLVGLGIFELGRFRQRRETE